MLVLALISALLVARASSLQASVRFTLYKAVNSRTAKDDEGDALSFVEGYNYVLANVQR